MRWLVSLLVLALPATTFAQPAAHLVVIDDGAPEARTRAWRARIASSLEETSLVAWADADEPVGTVTPERLPVLTRIEEHLVAARRHTAALEEREALREIGRAEELARASLTLPGMAAWYAEVQLASAATAAQAGLLSLADAAWRRASSIDPGRVVQLGEAPPEHVERARAIARELGAARSRFEVRASAEGAQAFVDDRPLGVLPQRVELAVGAHVLRVEAPGHRSWAAIVDVLEGDRPPVFVRLAPTRARDEAIAIEEAARSGDVERVDARLAALGGAPDVWMLWVGRGPEDRAVLVRCRAREGCARALRLEAEREDESELASALAWRDAERATPPVVEEPFFARWYVWVAAGAALVAGAAAITVAAQPQGPGPLQVTIDPSALPGF